MTHKADSAGTPDGFNERRLALPRQQRYAIHAREGRAVFGIDMRIVDGNGEVLSWDAQVAGELQVRGPWARSGNGGSEISSMHDGWVSTGNMARIDPDGFMQVTARSNDAAAG